MADRDLAKKWKQNIFGVRHNLAERLIKVGEEQR